MASLNQYPEMLLERIAIGARQVDGFADGNAPVLPDELNDLQGKFW